MEDTMNMLKTAVLVALLTMSAAAQDLARCGAGYEIQTMDEDTFGYCTRIPSLKEEADRAEAFLHSGVPRFMYACEVAMHLNKCANQRDNDLAAQKVSMYIDKIIRMGTHSLLWISDI